MYVNVLRSWQLSEAGTFLAHTNDKNMLVKQLLIQLLYCYAFRTAVFVSSRPIGNAWTSCIALGLSSLGRLGHQLAPEGISHWYFLSLTVNHQPLSSSFSSPNFFASETAALFLSSFCSCFKRTASSSSLLD